ncbi:hypothetical protein EDB81DRAFT_789918 [Dactylonectria macrodidyma]|uniref:Uncharacterized protein n=1 Tax=Dactylonectria macrodidyma TaxID=307937 RepID=A0A9P9F5V4_9HYPO|nr:hypothetical protein EDB81DRAFT_789918 [Dactylonectria macrodidyma]
MYRSEMQLKEEGLLHPLERGADSSVNRPDSPGIIRNVLRPLENKIYEYEVLTQQAHRQREQLDEEIRLMQHRRSMAKERFMMARAKRDEYERQHQDVDRALRGEPKSQRQRQSRDQYWNQPLIQPREQTREQTREQPREPPPSQPRDQPRNQRWPQPQPELEPESESEQWVARGESFDEKIQIKKETGTPSGRTRLLPSDKFTLHQMFYIFILSGIGGMIVSGGINFGLAYAMYTTQNTVENPIYLFQLPNTLAGDGAVTIIIQCIMTWFIEKGLVALDLSRRGIQPIGFIPMPTHPLLRWLFWLPQLGYDKAAEAETLYEPQGKAAASGFAGTIVSVLQEATRGFLIAIASFFLLWPASVGILIAVGEDVGGDFMYSDRWIPQIFKGILGGVLGLLTTPLMAGFWLIKAGWEGDRNPYLEG